MPQCKLKGPQDVCSKRNELTTSSHASASLSSYRLPIRTEQKSASGQLKKHTFFDLPGEIRNKVYRYVFDNRRVLVRKAHGYKKPKADTDVVSQAQSSSKPSRPYCGLYGTSIIGKKRLNRDDDRAHIDIDILFTCRKAYREGICYLYASITFSFISFKPIRRFLNHCRPEALGAIVNLQVYHVIYGEPALTADREWKIRCDKRWMDVCLHMSHKLTGLRQLFIDLRICDWPTQLNLKAAWAQPILDFGEQKFVDVKARLYHPCFTDEQRAAAARVLEEALMRNEDVEKRREEEALKLVELQICKERERNERKALEKLPVAERIEWEAMMAVADKKEKQQVVSGAKVLTITFPKNSSQQGANKVTNEGSCNQPSSSAGPSTAGNQAPPSAQTAVSNKKKTNKTQVHEGGYHGHKQGKELINPYGDAGLRVFAWDARHKTWVEKYIRQPPADW